VIQPRSATNKKRRRKKHKSPASSPKHSNNNNNEPPKAPTLTKKQHRANRAVSSMTLRRYLISLSSHLSQIEIPATSWGSTPPVLTDIKLQNEPASFPISGAPLKLTGTLTSGHSTRPFDDFMDEYEWISSADPSVVISRTQTYTPRFSDIGHVLTCKARIHPCASKSQEKLRSSSISKKDSSSDYLPCVVTTSSPVALSSSISDSMTSFLYVFSLSLSSHLSLCALYLWNNKQQTTSTGTHLTFKTLCSISYFTKTQMKTILNDLPMS